MDRMEKDYNLKKIANFGIFLREKNCLNLVMGYPIFLQSLAILLFSYRSSLFIYIFITFFSKRAIFLSGLAGGWGSCQCRRQCRRKTVGEGAGTENPLRAHLEQLGTWKYGGRW